MTTVGQRIRAARKAMNLTREDLAQRSGIPNSSLAPYELGTRSPGVEALERLAHAGISPAWLLLGEGPMLRSGPPRSQLERLQLALEAVQEGLEAVGRELPPRQFAELVMVALELLDEDDAEATKGRVVQLLRLAA